MHRVFTAILALVVSFAVAGGVAVWLAERNSTGEAFVLVVIGVALVSIGSLVPMTSATIQPKPARRLGWTAFWIALLPVAILVLPPPSPVQSPDMPAVADPGPTAFAFLAGTVAVIAVQWAVFRLRLVKTVLPFGDMRAR